MTETRRVVGKQVSITCTGRAVTEPFDVYVPLLNLLIECILLDSFEIVLKFGMLHCIYFNHRDQQMKCVINTVTKEIEISCYNVEFGNLEELHSLITMEYEDYICTMDR